MDSDGSDSFHRHTRSFEGISVAFERCPLCSTSRRPFTCQRCVLKGDFTFSQDEKSERYAEKLQKYQKLKTERNNLCSRLEKVLKDKQQMEEEEMRLTRLSERVGCMKSAVEEQKQFMQNDKQAVDDLIKVLKNKKGRGKIHKQKKDKIMKIIDQMKISLSILRCKLEEKEDKLCELRQTRVKQVSSSLFPISKVIISYDTHPTEQTSTDSLQAQSLSSTLVEVEEAADQEEEHLVAALAEARRMSYVKGRWVNTDNGNETQYSIVHPKVRLPANGDYSAYTQWVLREEDPLGNLDLHNDGHQTLAVLSFTTQLTTLMAFFLGIPLPKRIHYSNFLVKQLELKDFSAAVEKLCVNVLFLCCSQGADTDSLLPQNPLGNILHLLATSSSLFGRSLPFEINPELFLAAMSPPSSTTSLVSEASNFISEEIFECDSSSSEEHEWEAIPETDIPLIPSDVSTTTTGSHPSMQDDMSSSNMSQVAGNLMSSAASSVASALWRVASRQYDKS